MPLVFYRLSPTKVLRLIITVWTAFIVAFGPNYQKIAYQDTPARDYGYYDGYDDDNAGYPAGEGYPVLQSVQEMELYDNYVIEVDVKNLEQTNVYEYLLDGKMFGRAIGRAVNNNISDYGIGQYYVATLENGEKILLLLDDTALKIPKSGKMVLPIGKTCRSKTNGFFSEIQEKYQLPEGKSIEYADMAGRWRESEQMKELQNKKTYMYLGTMVGMIIIQVVIHVIYINVRKRIQDIKIEQ